MVCRLSIAFAVALAGSAPQMSVASDLFQTPPLVLPAPVPHGKPLSLSGCGTGANAMTVTDTHRRHRLGTTTLDVLGRKVLVFGRLFPSTNVAAQMGALDPPVVATAMVSRGAASYGEDRLPAKRTAGRDVLPSPMACAAQ
jgi:hypothetical protein